MQVRPRRSRLWAARHQSRSSAGTTGSATDGRHSEGRTTDIPVAQAVRPNATIRLSDGRVVPAPGTPGAAAALVPTAGAQYGGTGYSQAGFAARRAADLGLMGQQAQGGSPNNPRGVSDEGHTVFQPSGSGPFSSASIIDGVLTRRRGGLTGPYRAGGSVAGESPYVRDTVARGLTSVNPPRPQPGASLTGNLGAVPNMGPLPINPTTAPPVTTVALTPRERYLQALERMRAARLGGG